jgi:hypothetical protein
MGQGLSATSWSTSLTQTWSLLDLRSWPECPKAPPARIDIKFLEQYAEFLQFRAAKPGTNDPAPDPRAAESESDTPEEELEGAYLKVRASLASEILSRVKAGSPVSFERLVVELLLKMGYGGSRMDAGQAVGKAGDEGIDGIISRIASVWMLSTYKPKGGKERSGVRRFRSSSVLFTGRGRRKVCLSPQARSLTKQSRTWNISIPR